MVKKRTGHMGKAYEIDSPEEAVALYESWADEYDKDVVEEYGYVAPRLTAEVFARHVPEREARILDAGCGTGLAGVELVRLGYRTIDGLDISAEMLAVAREREIYRRVFEADMTGPLDLPDEAYDAVICVGTFTHGHVGPEGLDELIRVTAPGGIVCFTINEGVFDKYGFEDKFGEIEAADRGRIVEREYLEYLRETGVNAWVVTLKVA